MRKAKDIKLTTTACNINMRPSTPCLFTLSKDLGKKPFQEWPSIDKKMLENKLIEYVVQFNGKKRATLIANKDISESEIIEKIKKNKNINKFFEKKEINKIFFVKNRLVNFLIK